MSHYVFRVSEKEGWAPVSLFILMLSRRIPGLHMRHWESQGQGEKTSRYFYIRTGESITLEEVKQAMRVLLEEKPGFDGLKRVPDSLNYA